MMNHPTNSSQKGPKRYAVTDRWRITGTLRTTSPMHIGSGNTTARVDLLNEKSTKSCEVQAILLDHIDRPCIPGTALKGVLRAWAEEYLGDPKATPMINKLFGTRNVDNEFAESGCVEFLSATLINHRQNVPFVPHWDEQRQTGVLSHVCIDRVNGTAEAEKLFFEEFIPEGAEFAVRILANNCGSSELSLLLAILDEGSKHPTHALQFGANGVDCWGRVRWENPRIEELDRSKVTLAALLGTSRASFFQAVRPEPPTQKPLTPTLPQHVVLGLELRFRGPFLVNDKSRTHREVGDEKPHFVALKRANGQVWLPASSFRGALRNRAEFLANSLGNTNSIMRLFGDTNHAARLTIQEFEQIDGSQTLAHQDFVAIDRFTGGAADGAKFHANYADRPTLKTTLVLHNEGLQREDEALLAAALNEVLQGNVPFGFGGSKGYGDAIGTLDTAGQNWLDQLLEIVPRTVREMAPTTPSKPVEDLIRGTLTVTAGQTLGMFGYRIAFVESGKTKGTGVRFDQVSKDLRGNLADNVEVEFVMFEGKPTRVRKKGQPCDLPAAETPSKSVGRKIASNSDRFHHPYYFLRLEDRSKFKNELADASPIGHDRYHAGRISGTIRVRLTTETPLILCHDSQATIGDKGHKTYPVLERDGKPLLASSSVRGMLRAAYEAITNSRLGVFPFNVKKPNEAHLRRFGFRMGAGDGLSVVPIRIENGQARLMLGTNPELPFFNQNPRGGRWMVPGGLLHAAWVQRYETNVGPAPWAQTVGGDLPANRSMAWCWLERIQHAQPDFQFWAVREAALSELDLAPTPPPYIERQGKYSSLQEAIKAKGYFCITNQNIKNKHDERFFFETSEVLAPIDEKVRAKYLELIRDYQLIHEDEIKDRIKKGVRPDFYLGGEPGKTAWSRHVYESDTLEFSEGTLCYAKVAMQSNRYIVEALYPVMISRKLYDKSPLDLLPAATRLRPATNRMDLSPADRVFGWVNQDEATNENPAYRSHVRIGPIECTTSDAIVRETKTLAILGQPKPAQGRFYIGKQDGAAQPPGGSKEERGYTGKNRIRGPKIYPHHQQGIVPANAYTAEKSSQNRTIEGYVKKEACFEFDLKVTNLSSLEIGALLWLLSMPANRFLRLGFGKPLGFGSVRAEIMNEQPILAKGEDWTKCIGTTGQPAHLDKSECENAFVAAVTALNPHLLEAFQKAAVGFNGSIHYPRTESQAAGSGEHFKWFGENEAGQKLSLPDLREEECSLPIRPI